MNWFSAKVSYDKTMENGTQKKVTEVYLFDSLSYTECEARVVEELKPYIAGEFTIADIRRNKLSEIFYNENGDSYFEAKIAFITLDEKSGLEKTTSTRMLAQASDIKEALAVVEKGMEGTLADYKITSLKESKILDIFPYSADSDKKMEYLDEDEDNEK